MSAIDGKLELRFFVPLRLGRGENNREVRGQRIGRIQAERRTLFVSTLGLVRAVLTSLAGATLPPCTVTFTRVAPGRGLDPEENLPGSCKAVKDELAAILGVDDRDPRVTWVYEQEHGDWGLWVDVTATLAGPVLVERLTPKTLRKPRDLTDALLNHEMAKRRTTRGQPANVTRAAKNLLAIAKPAFIAPRSP